MINAEEPLLQLIAPNVNRLKPMFEDLDQSIPNCFEQAAARYPNRCAIKSKHLRLTYCELNQAANRLARAILMNCSWCNEVVALLVGYEAHEIIGLLSVLKAGKTLVGILSSYPISRSLHILDHSRTSLIVTDNDNLSLARELAIPGIPIINIDDLDPNISDENLELYIPPSATAAIVYTSGTTGQPKAVIQTHRNLIHAIWRTSNRFQICEEDREAILSSYVFLAGMVSILRDLLNGACIYRFSLKEEGSGNFIDLLTEEKITVFGTNPTTFRHLIWSLDKERVLPSIRLIYLVGELLYPKDVELYKKHFANNCLLVDLLGCSEIPSVCAYIMDKKSDIKTHVVPVGYEFDGQQVLLLNEDGKDAGLNNVGEVVIKSSYLSPGYLNQPALTDAAFLSDTSGGDMRLYRTGDLGLRLPDGCLLHLGRKDSQVKIRGHRVEIAEVAAALQTLSGIKEAAISTLENQYGEQILVGYFVPSNQPAPNISTLRRELADRLPEYMIPSKFVMMDALPLTHVGKVDYRSLPPPGQVRHNLDSTFILPRDDMENLLANIWKEILGIDNIGIKDNFFELGGNSLLVARLIIQIEGAFGKKLPLATIFKNPTVEQLSRVLNGDEISLEMSTLIPIQTYGSKWPFFCIAGVDALSAMARYLDPDQPVYGLIPHYWDDVQISYTIEQVASDCLNLIRSIQPEGPYLLGGYSFGGLVAFEMAHQLQMQGQEVKMIVLIDTNSFREKRSLKYYLYALYSHLKHGRFDILLDFLAFNIQGIFSLKLALKNDHDKQELKKEYIRNKQIITQMDAAMEAYTLRSYSGQIIFFEAQEKVSNPLFFRDPRSDWARVAEGGLEIHQIPGNHITMLNEKNIQSLAGILRACLDKAQNGK